MFDDRAYCLTYMSEFALAACDRINARLKAAGLDAIYTCDGADFDWYDDWLVLRTDDSDLLTADCDQFEREYAAIIEADLQERLAKLKGKQ